RVLYRFKRGAQKHDCLAKLPLLARHLTDPSRLWLSMVLLAGKPILRRKCFSFAFVVTIALSRVIVKSCVYSLEWPRVLLIDKGHIPL
ncbi:hypothetical protein, partial [Halomonas sp.]|uniref:hypothetical protein n=1 Tax=Halomonas sp. TaxID=1486246 RepID=UPI003F9585CC